MTTGTSAPEDISIVAEDGVRLAATLYPVDKTGPAGLVLIHEQGADRTRWAHFAQRAQLEQIACLAVDLRGHGESIGDEEAPVRYRDFSAEDWRDTLLDIEAAKQALLERGIDPDNVAVMGADIGANLALNYAVANSDIRTVVMVSPSLESQGIKTMSEIVAYGNRPVLLVVSSNDAASASACATLKKTSVGACELREYTGGLHGTDLLVDKPNAVDQVFVWLSLTIGPGIGADAP